MAKKKLTREEVVHIAQLCNLTLSEVEIDKLSEMLGETIDYIEVLKELETENVKETYQVTGLENVFQDENESNTTLSKKEALSNAHEVIEGKFATKAVFDRE